MLDWFKNMAGRPRAGGIPRHRSSGNACGRLLGCLGAAVVILYGSGCQGGPAGLLPVASRQAALTPVATAPPGPEELAQRLADELAQRGIDPQKTAAAAPAAGNDVFDLTATLIDPDGSGPLEPTGYHLRWTERLVGDYDENGEVNVSDLSLLGHNWQQTIQYANPDQHDGVKHFPPGDPAYAGEVESGAPPLPGSGAHTWRLARVDGDGNGEINLGDITPIAVYFKQRLDGYRIYRRALGESEFQILEAPDGMGEPLLVRRDEVNGGAGVDPVRPVVYEFDDEFAVDGAYEYRVVPYDAQSATEGPPSLPGFNAPRLVTAALSADITQGAPPFTVHFDAAQSSSLAGPITSYLWDLDGDGVLEESTGDSPYIARDYAVLGSWLASVEVSNAEGDSDVASLLISVTAAPVAKLTVTPVWLEVPVQAVFDASGSFDPDGEVAGYEWDLNHDGVFELDTGPLAYRVLAVEEPGALTVNVRVRDNLGATAVASVDATFTDNYAEQEPNDSFSAAMELGLLSAGQGPDDLLGSIGAGSYDGDDVDWYQFELAQGATVTAGLPLASGTANLHLALYGPDQEVLLADAGGFSGVPSLTVPALIGGRYAVKVTRGVGLGGVFADYRLSLAVAELSYDELEDNDSSAQAQALGNIDLGLLPQLVGSLGPAGYDGDGEDWFAFALGQAGRYRLDLRFFHSAGDLDLQLYQADGATLISSSRTVTDNETIVVDLTAGEYKLRCFEFDGGTANYWLSILNE